jgi:periplasmic divalent cation tolerance protein
MHLLYVSCPHDEARTLAERLVEERLVACVSILPGVESVYRWDGALERQPESILWMETSDDRVERAMERIEALHSYDVPKIVALEGARVNTSYEQWVVAETKAT